MFKFAGVSAALITPRGRQGDVDFGAAFELIDCCCQGGLGGILLFGEAGEYMAFPVEERSRLVYLGVKRSRVPLLVGVGSPTLGISLGLARDAADAGAAGVLLPPPAFFHYHPDEIAEFYLQFAQQIEPGTTVYLYNTPASTSEIPMEIAVDLLETGRFSGIVDASGNCEGFAFLRAAAARCSVRFLAGSDELAIEARTAGCGIVSEVAGAVPELVVEIERAIAEGNASQLDRLSGMLHEFLDWAGRLPRPVVLRTATGLRGIKTGSVPVPLPPAKQKLLAEFRDWFPGWISGVRRRTANA
jgi:4-hydroxy-tetrahydrodipicolinate synthase